MYYKPFSLRIFFIFSFIISSSILIVGSSNTPSQDIRSFSYTLSINVINSLTFYDLTGFGGNLSGFYKDIFILIF